MFYDEGAFLIQKQGTEWYLLWILDKTFYICEPNETQEEYGLIIRWVQKLGTKSQCNSLVLPVIYNDVETAINSL